MLRQSVVRVVQCAQPSVTLTGVDNNNYLKSVWWDVATETPVSPTCLSPFLETTGCEPPGKASTFSKGNSDSAFIVSHRVPGKGYIMSVSELLLFSGLLFFSLLLCSSSGPNPYSLLLCSQALRMWPLLLPMAPSTHNAGVAVLSTRGQGPSKQIRRTCWISCDFLLSLELGARFLCMAFLGYVWLSF